MRRDRISVWHYKREGLWRADYHSTSAEGKSHIGAVARLLLCLAQDWIEKVWYRLFPPRFRIESKLFKVESEPMYRAVTPDGTYGWTESYYGARYDLLDGYSKTKVNLTDKEYEDGTALYEWAHDL